MYTLKTMVLTLLSVSCCVLFTPLAASPATFESQKTILTNIYQQYKNDATGKTADYIPELAKVNPALFGIVIAEVNGHIEAVGDVNVPFAIESISKPFVYALALQDHGEPLVTDRVGLNATGHGFNSVAALEEKSDHLQNPMVNAGAIQITSLIKGQNNEDKWLRVFQFFKKLSHDNIYLSQNVYQSETMTNQHNKGITELLHAYGMITGDAQDALDRYTKACSTMVTAKQLALMGATLANGGIHPLTHERIIKPQYVRDVLSEMAINGLYENSGKWWWTVGLPAKSGVGGGLLAVVPGKAAIVVFSPLLDEAGNSVRGQKVIQALANKWQLHLLQASRGNKD